MKENSEHLNIKSLAEDDRPREKLLSMGRHHLSNAELIGIILGSGSKKETAVQLAQRMLSEHENDINLLAKLSISDYKRYKGIGTVKAINIAAAFELGRRRTDGAAPERTKITGSKVAYTIFKRRLSDLPHEEFWVLLLNRANEVLKVENISKGGISGTVVDIRLICKSAIENNVSGIVVAHNHPSGQINPSQQDEHITNKLKEALKLFGITLFDHLIIGDNRYYSFADEGKL